MVCLLLRPKSAVILLSCILVTFALLPAESPASSQSLTVDQDLVEPFEDPPSSIDNLKSRIVSKPPTPHLRPARIHDFQNEETEGTEDEIDRDLIQLLRQHQNQSPLYDVQPVFVDDNALFDVYLGTYPDKRPRPLNASAKRRRKRRKKKKKKVVVDGQVVDQDVIPEEAIVAPMQTRQYRGPTYDQRSMLGFHMKNFEAPWRYRMKYKLEWSVDTDLREQIEQSLTRVEIEAQEQIWQYEAGLDGDMDYQNVNATLKEKIANRQLLRAGSEIIMDFLLIPLDQVKVNELLLARIPISSMQTTIQLRPEILEGWYRLQIHFWEQPDPTSQNCDIFTSSIPSNKSETTDDWGEATESLLISTPGQLKKDTWTNNCFPRQVGLWRSTEAIEVTGLKSNDPEWREFVETLSHETRQEKWSLAEFSTSTSKAKGSLSLEQQRAILHDEYLAFEYFREPQPVLAAVAVATLESAVEGKWGLERLSRLHHRIKGFLSNSPWGSANNTNNNNNYKNSKNNNKYVVKHEPVNLSPTITTPSAMKKQKKRPYRRTIFPQDSFRYQKFVGPNIKDVVPDFFLHELEEFEDVVTDAFEALQERIEKQQNLQKLQMDQENQNEEIMIKDEEIAIYPMSVWDPEIARLQMLMDVWNNGAPLKKREDSNEATDGKAIEEVNGQDEKDKEEEEEDVDQEEEEEDEAMILETESVQGVRGLNLKIWQGAIETDPWVATTWRSNRDRIISWRIPPSIHILGDSLLLEIEIVATPVFQQSNHVSQWTREMIVNVALRQQQPSSILLTDRIPITWRAMQVKIPAWVPTGIYHIRVRGVSDDGSRFVEDLSQPFAVLSDPYIYS